MTAAKKEDWRDGGAGAVAEREVAEEEDDEEEDEDGEDEDGEEDEGGAGGRYDEGASAVSTSISAL